MTSESPTPPLDKKLLLVIFFTCFFDIVGFSIIIPLLPFMVSHYLIDTEVPVWIQFFSERLMGEFTADGLPSMETILVIGGSFAFLFAFCQYVSSPLWGKLSDRYGRSAILKWTILGTCIGHGLWFFSGTITLLLISRAVAGMMAGNISVATAAVADITTRKNRAAGMTYIGIAYGLGFITGPIIGGIASSWNLLNVLPELSAYGINPFSACALAAMLLSILNLICFHCFFRETLKPENRNPHLNISPRHFLQTLQAIPIAPVNQLGWINFIFFFTFVGIEFNLSFLAFDRYGFSKQESTFIYLLLGLSQTFFQWTLLKPLTQKIGEVRVAVVGFSGALLGGLCIALVHTPFIFYIGAAVMAGGAGLVFPSLTSLVSQFSPLDQQGAMLGAYRSKGSIGHALGPLAMSALFWAFGGTIGFTLMSMGFIWSIYLVMKITDKTEVPFFEKT